MSLLLVAVLTKDPLSIWEEPSTHQGNRALGAGKAGLVPLTILKGHILAITKACDGLAASMTLLGVGVTEALDTVGVLALGRKGLVGQGAFAACTHETLLVPGLVAVGNTTLGQSLFAVAAPGGKLALVARHTVVTALIWDEGLRTDGLLTHPAHKALLMPRTITILQLPRAWHDGLIAGHTLGGELIAVAVIAQ